jgi:hypothetical protein
MPIITRPSEVRYFSGKLTGYLQTLALKGITASEYDHIKQILTHYIDHHGMDGNLYEPTKHDHNAVLQRLRSAVGNSLTPDLEQAFDAIVSRIEREIHHTLGHVGIKQWNVQEAPVAPAIPIGRSVFSGMFRAKKQPLIVPPPIQSSPWEEHNNRQGEHSRQWEQRNEVHTLSEKTKQRFGEKIEDYETRLSGYIGALVGKNKLNAQIDTETALTAAEFIHIIQSGSLDRYFSMHDSKYVIRIKTETMRHHVQHATIKAHDAAGGWLLPVTCLLRQVGFEPSIIQKFVALDNYQAAPRAAHVRSRPIEDTPQDFQAKLKDVLSPQVTTQMFYDKHKDSTADFIDRLEIQKYHSFDTLFHISCLITSNTAIMRTLSELRASPLERTSSHIIVRIYRAINPSEDDAERRRMVAGHLQRHANVHLGTLRHGYYEGKSAQEILQRLVFWIRHTDKEFDAQFNEDATLFQTWILSKHDQFDIDQKNAIIWITDENDSNVISKNQQLQSEFLWNEHNVPYIRATDSALARWQQRFPAPAPPATGKKATDKVADLRTRLLALRAMREQSARNLVHGSDSLRPARGGAWNSSAQGHGRQADPSETLLRGGGPPPGAPGAAAGQPPRQYAGQPPSLIAQHAGNDEHVQRAVELFAQRFGHNAELMAHIERAMAQHRLEAMPPHPHGARGGPPHPHADERAQWPPAADGSPFRSWDSHGARPPHDPSWSAAAGPVRAGGAPQTYVLVRDDDSQYAAPAGGASAAPLSNRGGIAAGAGPASGAGGWPQGHMPRDGGGGSLGRDTAPARHRGGQLAEEGPSWRAADTLRAQMAESALGGSLRQAAAASALHAGGAPGLSTSRRGAPLAGQLLPVHGLDSSSRSSSVDEGDAPSEFDASLTDILYEHGAPMRHARSYAGAPVAPQHAAGAGGWALRSPSLDGRRGRALEREQGGRSESQSRSHAPSPSDTYGDSSLQNVPPAATAASLLLSPAARSPLEAAAFIPRLPNAEDIIRYWNENKIQLASNILRWNSDHPTGHTNNIDILRKYQTINQNASARNMQSTVTKLRDICRALLKREVTAKQWIADFSTDNQMDQSTVRVLLIAETLEKFIRDHTLEDASVRFV